MKQYPDVVLFAVGVSDLSQGRRIIPPVPVSGDPSGSARAGSCLTPGDHTAPGWSPAGVFLVGGEIRVGCREAERLRGI